MSTSAPTSIPTSEEQFAALRALISSDDSEASWYPLVQFLGSWKCEPDEQAMVVAYLEQHLEHWPPSRRCFGLLLAPSPGLAILHELDHRVRLLPTPTLALVMQGYVAVGYAHRGAREQAIELIAEAQAGAAELSPFSHCMFVQAALEIHPKDAALQSKRKALYDSITSTKHKRSLSIAQHRLAQTERGADERQDAWEGQRRRLFSQDPQEQSLIELEQIGHPQSAAQLTAMFTRQFRRLRTELAEDQDLNTHKLVLTESRWRCNAAMTMTWDAPTQTQLTAVVATHIDALHELAAFNQSSWAPFLLAHHKLVLAELLMTAGCPLAAHKTLQATLQRFVPASIPIDAFDLCSYACHIASKAPATMRHTYTSTMMIFICEHMEQGQNADSYQNPTFTNIAHQTLGMMVQMAIDP